MEDKVMFFWRRIMNSLNEAEIYILRDMLNDSIFMQQTANVINTPDSEEDILADNDIIPMVANKPPRDMPN